VLAAEDLVAIVEGTPRLTSAGRAHLARLKAADGEIDPFLAQHIEAGRSADGALVDQSESPLAWLARRKGRDGKALIEPHQFMAGERLRAEFTRAQLTPRITSSWSAAVAQGRRGESGVHLTDIVVAARQRMQQAADAVGPEFAGLLLDVCCFLKKLDEVERERQWPARSAKVVLQLGLERLARHYGLGAQALGRSRADIRIWLAENAEFRVET
jgi:hypothetical protein